MVALRRKQTNNKQTNNQVSDGDVILLMDHLSRSGLLSGSDVSLLTQDIRTCPRLSRPICSAAVRRG